MINLLPQETRNNMQYARRNNVLRKWLYYMFFALLGTVLIILAGVFYLSQTTKSLEKQTADAKQSLQAQNIEGVQAEVESISDNVKLTTQVLSRQILFSKLLTQLGSALPANTALQQLQIDKLQGGLTITAQAGDVNSATQIQVNLQDPKNQIFEKADIDTITCEADSAKEYPCLVQLRALFTQNNPFLFISPSGGS